METSKQAPEGNAPQRVPHISALPSFSITTGKGNLDRVSVTSDPQAPYSREAAAEKRVCRAYQLHLRHVT